MANVENTFRVIRVSGQSSIIADQAEDVLDLVAGSGINITTNASVDSITISATGGGGGGGYTGSAGVTGFTGSVGILGYTGSSGLTGYTGSQGPIGYTGSKDSSVHAIIIACSDETTALSAEANVVTFRMPVNFTITGIRASLTTAQTSGNIFTVDVNNNGSSILSTKITIDNNEKTSTTAATAPVVSSSSVSLDDELTVDIDQIGNGTATGLKVTILGNPV